MVYASSAQPGKVPDEMRFGELVGAAPCMRELFSDLARIACTDLSVLIEGETGTGKDLVASSLHAASDRASGPFVVLDCSAIAPTLVESELFGHDRGAFTGAYEQYRGVFERADGGTIFLDEVGELPRTVQPKLLRVLEQRQLRRLGDSKPTTVNVRVISATNRNLRAEVQRGAFREDLYYRLAGMHIMVPPLRQRPQDLELLVQTFLAAKTPPRSLSEVPPRAWEQFRAHRWPGNVRELRHALDRLLLSDDAPLEADPSFETYPPSSPFSLLDEHGNVVPLQVARQSTLRHFERTYVTRLLEKTRGDVPHAAALAGVSCQLLQRLVAKYHL